MDLILENTASSSSPLVHNDLMVDYCSNYDTVYISTTKEIWIVSFKGFCINITDRITSAQAQRFAQWIGAANVVRNQKIGEYIQLLKAGEGKQIGQGYSAIKTHPDLTFLMPIPVQILRNAASSVYADAEAAKKQLRQFPKRKGRNKKRSAIITKELFMLESTGEDAALLSIFAHAKKSKQKIFSIKLPYAPDRLASQFRISRQGAKFYLSGAYQNETEAVNSITQLERYQHSELTQEQLLDQITGIDRGVVRPIQTSEGLVIAYSPEQKHSLLRLAQRKAHYQRILARKKRRNGNKSRRPESRTQQKMADKIAQIDDKIGSIRQDFSHQASRKVVNRAKSIIALEALNLKGMTKRAKKKQQGRKFLKNQARAKSGLNRSLQNVALGRLGDYITYKAEDAGKAIIKIDPAYTSKTHHLCLGRHTERPDQATLHCLDCNVTENADENASKVIAYRAACAIKEGSFAAKAKPRKTIAARRKKTAELAPPLVCELASSKKSGEQGVVCCADSPVTAEESAGIRPAQSGQIPTKNALLQQRKVV